MRRFFILISIIVSAVSGPAAADWKIKPPKKTNAIEPQIAISDSDFTVPISLKTDDVEREIKQAFANKSLFKGDTQKLSVKALVDKKVTVQELVDVMISPAIPCEKKLVTESFKDGVNCLLPWKCVDVIKNRTREVIDCSKQKAATFQKQMQSVVKLKEDLFPTTAVLHYDVKLKDAKFKASGRTIKVALTFDADGSADVSQGAFGADITIKGALSCNAVLSAGAAADVIIRSDASIDLDLKDFALDWQKLCVPGAVQIAKITWALDPTVQIATLFKGALKAEIIKLLNKEVIDKSVEDNLKFAEKLRDVGQSLGNSIKLGDDVILNIEPKKLMVSQLNSAGTGGDNMILIDAGIVARPSVLVGIAPPPHSLKDIPFSVGILPTGIHLHLKAAIGLEAAKTKIKDALQAYLNANFGAQPFTVGDVELYQSVDKLVFGLEIVNRSDKSRMGTIYFWGRPVLDANSQVVSVADVGLDTSSQNILAKAAMWLVNAALDKVIEKNAKFDLDDKAKKIIHKLSKFETQTGPAKISGEVSNLKLEGIWLSKDTLNILILAEGSARVQLVNAPLPK